MGGVGLAAAAVPRALPFARSLRRVDSPRWNIGPWIGKKASQSRERSMSEDERIAQLTQKMLRKKLYVLLSKPLVAPEKLTPHLAAHLDYMIGLEKRGLLFASGPLADGDGPPSGLGLTILRASSAEQARKIAEAEPFFANGLRSYELKEWTIMEGTLGVRVNLSDQTIEVA
jgi:uncharacterized protein